MKFRHPKAERECRKLGCLTKFPILCRLIDFAALHPQTFETPKTPSYVWAYRWRRILFAAKIFIAKQDADDADLIKATGNSRRIRYDQEAKEWQIKGNGGPLYRHEAYRIIAKAAGPTMPKRGKKKIKLKSDRGARKRRLQQMRALVTLAQQLERRSKEIIYFVASGKRPHWNTKDIPSLPIPKRFIRKPQAKKKPKCKSRAKQ